MIAAPLALAAAVASGFAPLPGVPYAYRIAQTRTIGAETHRYVLIRRVVFRPLPSGWIADLSFVGTDGSADPEAQVFRRIMAAMTGRTLRFHLDRGGTVVGVDDLNGCWAILARAISGPGDPVRAKAFAGFDAATRFEFVSSMLGAVNGVADIARAAGTRPVRIPAVAPGAPRLNLTGTEAVSRARDGMIDVALSASGALPPPGGTIATEQRRRTDPVTGLIVERQERRVLVVGAQRMTIATTTTVTR